MIDFNRKFSSSLPNYCFLYIDKLEVSTIDYYSLLAVSQDSGPAEIKTAYHRALLTFHPDKHKQSTSTAVDINSIKEAYAILVDPLAKSEYDLRIQEQPNLRGPRPAQVVSLEDFEETACKTWHYGCRCGGFYKITEDNLEQGKHVIGCESCSEIVWVGYELVEEDTNCGS